MEDFNKKLNEGWNKIYKQKLTEAAAAPLPQDDGGLDDDSPEQRIHELKQSLAASVKKVSDATIKASNARKMFNDWFAKHAKGTNSIGDSHYTLTNVEDALKIFAAPEDQKFSLIKKIDPQAPEGNGFAYHMFLNDYSDTYDKNKAEGNPQGPLGHKPSDMAHRKPHTQYMQPNLQKFANEKMLPLLTVVFAGKEGLKELKQDPARAEIFADPLVKMFMNVLETMKAEHVARALAAEDKKELQGLMQPIQGYKKPVANDDAEEKMAEVAMNAGPGRVMPENFVAEQTEQVADVSSKNKKLLTEGWNKFQDKNKDKKNDERPDDFTLLMG